MAARQVQRTTKNYWNPTAAIEAALPEVVKDNNAVTYSAQNDEGVETPNALQ